MQKARNIYTAIVPLIFIMLQACAAGIHLMPKPAEQVDAKRTYTLILYGCRYASDLENIAVLVDEKSNYSFEVYALEGMYKVKKGISGADAFREANVFVNCSMHTVWQTMLRRLADASGKTIAYELKPLYRPWEFRTPEVLLSSYTLNDGKVTAYFTLDPSLRIDDSPFDWPKTLRRY